MRSMRSRLPGSEHEANSKRAKRAQSEEWGCHAEQLGADLADQGARGGTCRAPKPARFLDKPRLALGSDDHGKQMSYLVSLCLFLV